MNFATVEGRALKHALRALVETVERRGCAPVLACVKLSFSAEGLRLEATDLDVWTVATLDVMDGAGDWSLCLMAHTLEAIAKVAGPMPMRIEPGEQAKATIRLGQDEVVYTLDPLPANDFPDCNFAEPGALLERFTNGMLVSLLDKVRAFISTEETRYYLNGVVWQQGEFGTRFAATDGHRLAICTYGREPAEKASRIIPRKAVALLGKHMAGRDVTVHAAKDKLGLIFEAPGLTLRTKLIDGTYPEIDRVVPPPGEFVFTLKRGEVLAAFARLGALGRDVGRVIKFEGRDGRLVLERKSHDGGASVPISSSWPVAEGKTLAPVGFNSVYVDDMVRGCEGDVSLAISDPAAPALIRDADPAMTRVLMPMRV